MQLSLVIPAYNEENRILSVLKSYSAFLNNKFDYEIIVVSDGIDGTAGIVREMMITSPRIRLLEFGNKLGKGGALVQGFTAAGGNAVGFVDSDESVKPEEFRKLIDALGSGDAAIASRYVEGACISVAQSPGRRISSRVFNILVNLMFGLGLKDTQCGAKVFRNEAIKSVLPSIRSNGFEFDVELLWRMKLSGYRIKEIPIVWKHEGGSRFSFFTTPSMFLNLLALRLMS